jgi:hypothetical protein
LQICSSSVLFPSLQVCSSLSLFSNRGLFPPL